MEPRHRNAVRIRTGSRITAPPGPSHRFAVFTAVDGTLLHARTFEAGPARPLIQRLQTEGIPVIPVSIMTLDELAPLAADLGLRHAMVLEMGCAIARWTGQEWAVESFGPPAETMLDVVREIEDRSKANLLVCSALSETEARRLRGKSAVPLHGSTHGCFSEPFLVESGELHAITRAAGELGVFVWRGRHFLHLCRACDQGSAFLRVRDELRCETTIALGGSMMDAEFLAHADVPIIVPGPDGVPDADLLEAIPHARVAPGPAPEGWVAAIEGILSNAVTPKRHQPRAAS